MNKNKIELLVSANWSRTNWDLSWQPIIELSELLPKVGESYEIILLDSEARNTSNGIYHFLWYPPHSELNTLCDRPTEVLKAFIIEAELIQSKWIKHGLGHSSERYFFAKIISIRQLIDYFPEIQSVQESKISKYFQCDPFATDFFQWDNFCLFIVRDQYQHSTLLFNIDQENYSLVFVDDWISYSYDSFICNDVLDVQQVEFLKKYMIPTNKLSTISDGLKEGHLVEGAKYM